MGRHGYPFGPAPGMIAAADRVAADMTDELAGAPLELDEILRRATSALSRSRPGLWVALVLNRDPATSTVAAEDEGDRRALSYVHRYIASLVGRGTVPTAGMSRTVIETGEPVLVPIVSIDGVLGLTSPSARDWHDQHPPPVELKTISTIVVPMRAQGQTLGTLQHLVWNAEAPLSQADVAWVQVIADRLAVFVEHAQCHGTSAVRLERLTALRNVALAIAASQDLRLTLHLILEQLVARLGVVAADVLQVDGASRDLHPSASVGFHSGWAGDIRIPMTAELADSGASGRRFELRSDPLWLGPGRRSLFAREGFTSYRAVPLMARTQLLGVLEVFARAEFNVDEEWIGFLHAMAVTAAVAIDNANLHDRVERGSGTLRAIVPRPELSALDWRILAMVVEGATNREIAGSVHLSENTIKFHIRRLLDRLGAVNRTDLARKATQNSWL